MDGPDLPLKGGAASCGKEILEGKVRTESFKARRTV